MTRVDIDRRCTTPVGLRGKQGAVHPVILAGILQETLIDGTQVDDERVVHWSIMVHHSEPEKYSLAIARHLKCSSSTRARRRGERPTQTARALGPRTVCSCPSVSLGNTSAFGEA
jgi:hypothetical protein